jgi:L-ascorbate metabolism protein UlaG (beta-lactamase superfamily)
MWIRWHGHSCFELKDGATVITDPHDGKSIGIPAPNLKGDIVVISHDHFDHNCARIVKGQEVSVIKDPIMTVERGVRIQGIETYHDASRGEKRGRNIVFRIEMDGVSFCHLGDLGHMLDDEQLSQVGTPDILFIPVGNVFTLDVKSAVRLAEAIKPKVIIPMHYRIGGLSLSIRPVDDFLAGFPEDRILKVGNEMEFKPSELPENGEVWVFSL